MATLERSRQLEESTSLTDARSTRQRQEDAASSFWPLNLPVVPTYDPRKTRTETSTESSTSGESQGAINHLSVQNEHKLDDDQITPLRNGATVEDEDEDEMEEVLEELQDDVQTPSGHLRNEEEYTIEPSTRDMDTLALLSTAQVACLALLEPLLHSIQANATQTELLGGPQVVETLIEASRSATNSTVTSPAVPATSLANMRDAPPNQPLNRLIELLENITKSTVIEVERVECNDEGELLESLQRLMVDIDAAKWTADLLDDQGDDSFEIVSTSASQLGSSSSSKVSHPSPMAGATLQRQLKTQSMTSNGRQTPTSPVHLASVPSPSSRREELRDPFADSIAIGQTSPLWSPGVRSEGEREAQGGSNVYSRFMRVLQDVDARSEIVLNSIESLPNLSHYSTYHEATLDASNEGKRQMQYTWKQLQKDSKAIQIHLAKRIASRSTNSPTYNTLHYSPPRARSRKNSSASFSSLTASLRSLEAGDPIGEATAAGIGIGASRSLSRQSAHNNHSSAQAARSPMSSSIQMMRRGSTKSEHSAPHSIQSLPPRYSEDTARTWAGYTMMGANQSVDVNTMARSRTGSIGGLSGFSTRTLPAYDNGDITLQHLQMSKKGGSTASLVAPERSRSCSVSGRHTSEKTLQDLNVVKDSIERLYTAVPQLEDQRAWSPDQNKKRNAEKQVEMLDLFEKLSKGGRMEDQRVTTPVSSRQFASASTSKVRNEGTTTPETPTNSSLSNGRAIRRLGSISFGSLSLRRAASVLSSDGKGKGRAKEREKEGRFVNAEKQEGQEPVGQSQEQSVSITNGAEAMKASRPSILNLMGLSTFDVGDRAHEKHDDDLFDVLTASLTGSRMSNQDAIKRANPVDSYTAVRSPVKGYSGSSTIDESSVMQAQQGSSQSGSNRPIDKDIHASTSAGESSASLYQDDTLFTSNDRLKHKDSNPNGMKLHYIAETQPRLGLMPVQIWIEGGQKNWKSITALSYAIEPEDRQMLTIIYVQHLFKLSLPCQTSTDRRTEGKAEWDIDRWNFRLQMSQNISDDDVHYRQEFTPLSAALLQKMRPSALSCNGCSNSIAKTDELDQYLPLPSQHWEELVDAWMCHADQELNEGMIDTQKKLDEHQDVQRRQARVSEDDLIIVSSLLVHRNTSIDSLKRIRCRKCHALLGSIAKSGAAKLHKYAFHPHIDQSGSCNGPLLAQVIADKLVRLSQAHSTRHFVVRDDEDDNTIHLKLWLFSEHFRLSSNAATILSPLIKEGMSACKIMYQASVASLAYPSPISQERAWSQPDLVENLTYPKEVCLRLKYLLEQSTLCYPPSSRSFGPDWIIGFLQTSR